MGTAWEQVCVAPGLQHLLDCLGASYPVGKEAVGGRERFGGGGGHWDPPPCSVVLLRACRPSLGPAATQAYLSGWPGRQGAGRVLLAGHWLLLVGHHATPSLTWRLGWRAAPAGTPGGFPQTDGKGGSCQPAGLRIHPSAPA